MLISEVIKSFWFHNIAKIFLVLRLNYYLVIFAYLSPEIHELFAFVRKEWCFNMAHHTIKSQSEINTESSVTGHHWSRYTCQSTMPRSYVIVILL